MSDKQNDDSHSKGGGHGGGHGAHGGGGGGHEEGHEGAPEWLISFADNVALMMGFFVILLAMEMAKPKGTEAAAGESATAASETEVSPAMLDLALSIREGFNRPVSIDSTNPDEQALVQRLREKAADAEARDRSAKGRNDEVQTIRPTRYRGAGGVAHFERGASTLDEPALRVVRDVANLVRGQKSIIEIRGHASAAEGFERKDHGFELSYRRALAVAEALAEAGVTWDRLRLVSSGDNHRAVTPEHNATAMRENQRAEIIALADRAGGDAAPDGARDAGGAKTPPQPAPGSAADGTHP